MRFFFKRVLSLLKRNQTIQQHLIVPLVQDALASERRRVSQNYLRSIRGIHRGKRGFVVCNGPSLRMGDLDCLSKEISIASNLIYLAFENTIWKPNYVTVIDSLVWNKIADLAHEHYQSVIISESLDPTKSQSISYEFRELGHAPFVTGQIAFSEDITDGAFGGSSVTYSNLQLARHLGLNPVYLIGCDHYYSEPETIKEGVPVTHIRNNHFSDKYRSRGELVNPAPIENMSKSFEIAQAYCEATDFKIYNATRGGNLEAFPRVFFDELNF